jgi:hypothetical protein
VFIEVTAATDFVPSEVSGGGSVSSSAATTPSVSATPSAAGDVCFGLLCVENTVAITSDTDTLNGTWSTAQNQTVGTGVAGVTAFSQYKVVSATGIQTFNPVISTASDSVTISMVITEVAAATSFDPMGRMGFFGL